MMGMKMNSETVREQAGLLLEAGDLEGAFDVYERGVSVLPRDEDLVLEYGGLLWSCYAYDAAESLFEKCLAGDAVSGDFVKCVSRLYFEAGHFGAAAEAMGRLVGRGDVDESTLTLYASALERDGKRDEARAVLERGLKMDPRSVRGIRLMAHLDKRDGVYDQAIVRIESHLARYSGEDDWRLKYELAGVLDRVGDYDGAWEALLEAKGQLRVMSEPFLEQSYVIRKRQWEVTNKVTDRDLANWRGKAAELNPGMRVCLMAGFPRSGTTLLEQMLASHPDCIGTDETGVLGSQFTSPFVWHAETADEALDELCSFDDEQLMGGRGAYLHATEQFIGERVGSRLLIEKEPMLTSDLLMPLRLLPEASVLMPLRDPRDVLVSYFFTMVPLNWSSAGSCDILEAGKFYADTMRHWLNLRDRICHDWHEIRYEDLVADQRCAVGGVSEFLGLGWDDVMLDGDVRSERKAIRTPTYDDITKPITNRAVGRWRNYEKYMGGVMAGLEPYLKAFDYD